MLEIISDNWVRAVDVPNLYNVNRNTFFSWLRRDKIKSQKVGGNVFCEKKDLEAYIGIVQATRRKSKKTKNVNVHDPKYKKKSDEKSSDIKAKADVDVEAIENGEITLEELENRPAAKGNISRAEAERLCKIEEAIKRRRENLLEQKKYIKIDDFKQEIADLQSLLWNNLKEAIEKWGISLSLAQCQIKELKEKFELEILKTYEKISRME